MSEIYCDCGPGQQVGGQCKVIREARLAMTAEGRAQLMAEYRGQVPGAIEMRERSNDPRDLEYRMQRLGVPGLVISALRHHQQTPTIEAAKKFVAAPSNLVTFLALIGPVGQGKTVAAAYALREVARHTSQDRPTGAPAPLQWVDARSFTRVSQFGSDDEIRLREMRGATLLVLDDLGDEASEIGKAAVVDLMLSRDTRSLRTVITSNLRPDAFQERYGHGLVDRIRSRGVTPTLWKKDAQSMRPRAMP